MVKNSYYPVIKDDDLISQVENYQEAKADKNVMWHLHHRLAITFNLNVKQMREWNIYNFCDPEDLIFLTPKCHRRIHTEHAKLLKKKQ